MTRPPVEPIAYRVDDAARVVGLSRTTLYALISDGTLPSYKVAGRRLVRRVDLETLFAGSGAENGAANRRSG